MTMVVPTIGGTRGPDFAARWRKARQWAMAEGFRGLYVTAGPTFTWLSGYAPYPGGWPDFASCLLLPMDRDPVMLISAMHAEILDRAQCPIENIHTYVDGEDPLPALRAGFKESGIGSGRVGVEHHIWLSDVELAKAAQPGIELVRSELFDGLRAVKDQAEIALLRQSAACQDAAFAAARDVMRPGSDLGEAELAIRGAMLAKGCESIKLLGIFRSPRPRRFEPGELIDIDFGTAFCGGYTIDSSRNVHFGQPSAEIMRQWQVVEDAFQAACGILRAGVTAAEVHRAGAEIIENAGYRQTWKMGHGVGLSDGHETPWLQVRNETPLDAGMTFTIDPGFFLARDLPLHIEDTVLLTETGWESLNRFSHDIIVV